jgi:hypothetical protein
MTGFTIKDSASSIVARHVIWSICRLVDTVKSAEDAAALTTYLTKWLAYMNARHAYPYAMDLIAVAPQGALHAEHESS